MLFARVVFDESSDFGGNCTHYTHPFYVQQIRSWICTRNFALTPFESFIFPCYLSPIQE